MIPPIPPIPPHLFTLHKGGMQVLVPTSHQVILQETCPTGVQEWCSQLQGGQHFLLADGIIRVGEVDGALVRGVEGMVHQVVPHPYQLEVEVVEVQLEVEVGEVQLEEVRGLGLLLFLLSQFKSILVSSF